LTRSIQPDELPPQTESQPAMFAIDGHSYRSAESFNFAALLPSSVTGRWYRPKPFAYFWNNEFQPEGWPQLRRSVKGWELNCFQNIPVHILL
jgi:hypothetical protein